MLIEVSPQPAKLEFIESVIKKYDTADEVCSCCDGAGEVPTFAPRRPGPACKGDILNVGVQECPWCKGSKREPASQRRTG